MDDLLLERLKKRDDIEARFSDLFEDLTTNDSMTIKLNPKMDGLLASLKGDLKLKDSEISKLEEFIHVMDKNNEKLNDELISINIENNVLQEKLSKLKQEHNKLVQRWLKKVQAEVDAMNARIDSHNTR